MNEIKVLFFATLRDRAGRRETQLRLPEGTPVSKLKQMLGEQFPDIRESLPTVLVAVNREFAFDHDPVPDGAEVALFPPVSGGTDTPDFERADRQAVCRPDTCRIEHGLVRPYR